MCDKIGFDKFTPRFSHHPVICRKVIRTKMVTHHAQTIADMYALKKDHQSITNGDHIMKRSQDSAYS